MRHPLGQDKGTSCSQSIAIQITACCPAAAQTSFWQALGWMWRRTSRTLETSFSGSLRARSCPAGTVLGGVAGRGGTSSASAMAWRYLGETFDIHAGGSDLLFPHHENERAQSLCAFKDSGFARIWIHNGMVRVEGQKMSKSLGNFTTVRDALMQAPGEAIRFMLLRTHYRAPLDFRARA